MSVIAAVQPALPPRQYQQEQITEMFLQVLDDPSREQLVRRLHRSTRVNTRHLALELDEYRTLTDFGAANDAFIEHSVALASSALQGALDQAGLCPRDVDVVFSTTVTGIAAPAIEARVAAIVGLRPDVKRVPMFGLGCVAGAAGIARLHDHLCGSPDSIGVLLSAELCSLTMQGGDASTPNLVASGLFGDGATAVVMLGDARAERESSGRSGPRVVASRSHLYPDTLRTMGWDVTSGGLKIVLDADVPAVVRTYLAADVDQFLGAHGLSTAQIATWVCHPGGPKVIEAIRGALSLPAEALELTWRSLATVGNLSSSSVLHVLSDTIEKRPPSGAPGVLMAMGPGFCSELVLLRWQ